MNITKPILKSKSGPSKPNVERRSFIRKTGAAMTAVLASAVAGTSKSRTDPSAALKGQIDQLSNQLGMLEDANAIRKLHQIYERHLDNHRYEDVVDLFAEDAEVYFNGGIFLGKDKGVRRLYLDHFSRGLTGKKIEPAPGFQMDPAQQQEIVEVAPDRQSAKARFPYSMQVGTPIVSDSQLVQMARLQGQGIMQWWEGGICEISYMKAGDSWKIQKLDYRSIWQVDHALGWSYIKPISVPLFSKTYPENPTGPDKLIEPASELRKG